MRLSLRPRRRHATPPDAGNAPFSTWTTVGNLDGAVRGMVDASGRVAVAGHGFVVDWWIGAEDRWHRPAEEAAVRQHLLRASPVLETRVRIPSGDAVHRTYGARGPRGEDLVVLEVENDSKVPVALALVVRPAPGAEIRSLDVDGRQVVVDAAARLHLGRAPGRMALSSAADERSAGEVALAGDAGPMRARQVTCPDGAAEAVLLFPLAHTARFRAALALGDTDRALDVSTLPSPDQVASGWATHSSRGARVEVPDRRLRDAIAAATRSLLLDGAGGAAALALGRLGFGAEARERLGEPDGHLGDALAGWADQWRLHRTPLEGDEALDVALLVERWGSRPGARSDDLAAGTLLAVADLLERSGEGRAAADVRGLAMRHAGEGRGDRPGDLAAWLARATPTWSWPGAAGDPDTCAAARFLLDVRAHLVDDAGSALVLSPVVPEPWLGQGWEVHDLPTARGVVSFAVRWHGERPALLWELRPHEDEPGVVLRCGLDSTWSSTAPAGEALLAPVAVPPRQSRRRGLTIPVAIEPVRRSR